MAQRSRKEMIVETRAKLIAAARQAFGQQSYADASMDDFTAQAGLTRGALYHHFGDKKGLFEAVVMQIDHEMMLRLLAISADCADPWEGFVMECSAYLQMALEPEIQRIVHRDGPAVLGDPSQWANQSGCITSMTSALQSCIGSSLIQPVDAEATARLINGATIHAAQWIANADDPDATLQKANNALEALMSGLLRR